MQEATGCSMHLSWIIHTVTSNLFFLTSSFINCDRYNSKLQSVVPVVHTLDHTKMVGGVCVWLLWQLRTAVCIDFFAVVCQSS